MLLTVSLFNLHSLQKDLLLGQQQLDKPSPLIQTNSITAEFSISTIISLGGQADISPLWMLTYTLISLGGHAVISPLRMVTYSWNSFSCWPNTITWCVQLLGITREGLMARNLTGIGSGRTRYR